MHSESPHEVETELGFWQRLPHYVGYLALWLAYGAVTFWLVFQWQVIVVAAAVRFKMNPWQVRALDLYSMTAFFFAWLIGVIVVEAYLRHGVGEGRLRHRAGRVLLGTSIAAAVTLVIQWLLT